MDLHGMAAGAIGAVNPFVAAQYLQATGTTTNRPGSWWCRFPSRCRS